MNCGALFSSLEGDLYIHEGDYKRFKELVKLSREPRLDPIFTLSFFFLIFELFIFMFPFANAEGRDMEVS